jgi:phosphonate C-P lyase system protein PhnH
MELKIPNLEMAPYDLIEQTHFPFRAATLNANKTSAAPELKAFPEGLLPETVRYLFTHSNPATRVWLAEECRNNFSVDYLRRHIHCPVTEIPEAAKFAVLDHISDLNILSRLTVGTDEIPFAATTVIVQVEDISELDGVSFNDPITGYERKLNPLPLPVTFWQFRERASSSWQTGLDFVFTSPDTTFLLPRSLEIRYQKFC